MVAKLLAGVVVGLIGSGWVWGYNYLAAYPHMQGIFLFFSLVGAGTATCRAKTDAGARKEF